MTVTATHTHYGVVSNGTVIGSIVRQNIATQSQINGEITSGQIYRSFLSLYSQKIAPGFSTYAIASALGLTGPLGFDISSGFDFYAQKDLDGGARASGANHRKYTFNAGILVPKRLSVDHQGDATLDYEMVIIYDGSNDPIVVTDSVALPAGITDNERFTMAGMTIGSVAIAAKTRWSIDFGVDAVGQSADSDVWDTFASIRTSQSELTVETIDVSRLAAAAIPLTGKAATHATSTIYLRKRDNAGTFVADGTASHIALSCDGMIVPDDAFSSDGKAPGKVSFKMPLRYDGTNVPLLVTTNTTIS